MDTSSKQEQLRELLQAQQSQLQHTFPLDRRRALLALTDLHNQHYLETLQHKMPTTLLASSGWQKALSLCFSAPISQREFHITERVMSTWAASTLQTCSLLAQGERILEYCEAGFLRMQYSADAQFHVWVASKKMPTAWREREDLAIWADILEQSYAPEARALESEKAYVLQQLTQVVEHWSELVSDLYVTTRAIDDYYLRLSSLSVKKMVPFNTYPSSTVIGDCTFQVYREVLSVLVSFVHKYFDCCMLLSNKQLSHHMLHESYVCSDVELVKVVANTLTIDEKLVRSALDAYTLDAENVSYHSALDVPEPPLIRLDEGHRVLSFAGLLTEPLFFLLRELKRKHSYEYHTASQVREDVFRQDVYRLFADKRFVKSSGHVELKGAKGMLTTDVDALLFDRKTGALALFELKSQDPFAYSRQERLRQRDNFYAAGKQVVAAIEWVKRNGVNALLERLDAKQVKHLKAQKVYVFVLGRYLAHFFEGSEHDGRAAWGTWVQVLCLLNAKAIDASEANPIQSLFNRLLKEKPLAMTNKEIVMQEIVIGETRIRVYPSFEIYRNAQV